MFTYHKIKYKSNRNNFQINNLLQIVRNQINLDNQPPYNEDIYFNKPPVKKKIITKTQKYRHIRNQYLTKYSYMNLSLDSLFFS
jgi:hypothetical protein